MISFEGLKLAARPESLLLVLCVRVLCGEPSVLPVPSGSVSVSLLLLPEYVHTRRARSCSVTEAEAS